jgi:hypothetical protein
MSVANEHGKTCLKAWLLCSCSARPQRELDRKTNARCLPLTPIVSNSALYPTTQVHTSYTFGELAAETR